MISARASVWGSVPGAGGVTVNAAAAVPGVKTGHHIFSPPIRWTDCPADKRPGVSRFRAASSFVSHPYFSEMEVNEESSFSSVTMVMGGRARASPSSSRSGQWIRLGLAAFNWSKVTPKKAWIFFRSLPGAFWFWAR